MGGDNAGAAAEIPRFIARSRRAGPLRRIDLVDGPIQPGGAPGGGAPREAQDGRALLRLPPPVTAAVDRMAAALGRVSRAEVVRRGLILVDFMLSLGDEEELVVRNRATGRCDRLRFSWDAHPARSQQPSGAGAAEEAEQQPRGAGSSGGRGR
jgi:hypothetical protein